MQLVNRGALVWATDCLKMFPQSAQKKVRMLEYERLGQHVIHLKGARSPTL